MHAATIGGMKTTVKKMIYKPFGVFGLDFIRVPHGDFSDAEKDYWAFCACAGCEDRDAKGGEVTR
jgi:hypothetical protein